jgi:hypothetical protein
MKSDLRPAAAEPGDDVLDDAAPDAVSAAVRPTLGQRIAGNPSVAITVVALLVFGFFSLTTQTFLTEFNLINVLHNAALIGIVAVGMTYLLIAGEIDLSVGSLFGFLNVIMGLLVVAAGIDPWLAMGLVILRRMAGWVWGPLRGRSCLSNRLTGGQAPLSARRCATMPPAWRARDVRAFHPASVHHGSCD